ncbi:MAG: PIN domain-containing protein [Candidatus Parabeggiatoa sp.]|nr:PIN domain-containing protein [Candidatus Parabeggiatoa sp.]
MITREMIHTEIDSLGEDRLDELYALIMRFIKSKRAAKKPSLMSKRQQIQIDAPEDFSTHFELLEKRVQKPIFVDTVFVLALLNRRDMYHEIASQLAKQFKAHALLITDAVLLEIGNALARNYKKESIKIIEHFFDSDEIEVVRLTPKLFNQTFELYKNYDGMGFSRLHLWLCGNMA